MPPLRISLVGSFLALLSIVLLPGSAGAAPSDAPSNELASGIAEQASRLSPGMLAAVVVACLLPAIFLIARDRRRRSREHSGQ